MVRRTIISKNVLVLLVGLFSLEVIDAFSSVGTLLRSSRSSLLFSNTANAATDDKGRRVQFTDLDPSSFRHPYDRNLTAFVQKQLPGGNFVEEGIRRTFPLVEQGVRLDLLSSAVKVSTQQLPEIYNLFVEACQIMDLNKDSNKIMPELYVQSSSQANAYTLAFQGKYTPPIVVVTSALLDRCTHSELQSIIGHELGHVKCEHSLYLTLGSIASTPLRTLPFAGPRIDAALQQWRLAAEYTCDRAALLVAQDANVVNSALVKLLSGTSKYQVDTQAFIAQCLEYDELLESANPLVRAAIRRQTRTHPLPVRRVAELQKWSESDEYKKLLGTGVELEMAQEAEKEEEL